MAATNEALDRYARAADRAVWVEVDVSGRTLQFGRRENRSFPAASLLKLPLAMAVETALAEGCLEDAPAPVSQVRREGHRGVLHTLVTDPRLAPADLLGLAVAVSDNDAASWLATLVDLAVVREIAGDLGCRDTRIDSATRDGVGPYEGVVTARDAVRLVRAAADRGRYPLTAAALANSVHASRIPLGAQANDVALAHKTGSLAGVAHDVAVVDCRAGSVSVAFLSEGQHDTLVTGYEMGICTREILSAWDLTAQRTVGVL